MDEQSTAVFHLNHTIAPNNTSESLIQSVHAVSTANSTVLGELDVTIFDPDLEKAKRVLFIVQYVLLPLFLVTGLFGNISTVAIMLSRRFSHLTCRYILTFLAISDTMLLVTQPFNKLWVIGILGVDARAISDFSCKAFFVIFRSAKMTSSWLVVMLCFERYIAVVFPLKAKLILRKRFICFFIFLNYAVMFIYNSMWSFSSQIFKHICKPDAPSSRHEIFVVVGCSFYSFIPTFLLMIFTPQIVIRLIVQRKVRRSISNNSSTNARTNKRETEMLRASIMVTGVMVAYIILIIPITLVHIYAFIMGVSAFDMTSYGFFIFREIAQMLEQINYAVNFFFYVLCSTVFRQRVKEVLCCTHLCSHNESNSCSSESLTKDKSSLTISTVSSTLKGDQIDSVKLETDGPASTAMQRSHHACPFNGTP